MVKHHIKGKKKKQNSKNAKAEAAAKTKDQLKNLDRFAGSSEEEGPDHEDTDDESVDESNAGVKELEGNGGNEDESPMDEDEPSSDEDEYGDPAHNRALVVKKPVGTNSDDDGDPDDDDDTDNKIAEDTNRGMSGAMARILGIKAPAKAKEQKGIVLSKTTTPLQRQQKKEKEQHDALKLKRRQRRQVALTALHVPLSAATTRPIIGKDQGSDMIAKAMGEEIKLESMHRRVATRGVVALFNTIAQHQQQKAEQASEGITSKKSQDVSTMSKHGFLDMLKKKGTSTYEKSEEKAKSKAGDGEKKASGGWNALKDDFMMTSKLEDMSEEEESDDEDGARGEKRGADDDALMDDDWSSDDDATTTKKQKIDA